MSDTIGQQLSSARLARKLTIDQVAGATRLRAPAIAALEADDFQSFPSSAQARGFLKIYAEFLGLSLPEMYSRQREAAQAEVLPNPETGVETIPSDATPKVSRVSRKEKKSSRKKQAHLTLGEEEAPSLPDEVSEPAREAEIVEQEIFVPPPTAEPTFQESTSGEPQANELQPSASQAIFTAIGEQLHQRRHILSLSLDEIEKHIHVRRQHLEYLEAGLFSNLPSSVQARGMLSNFASFLDLDVDAIMLQFADGLQARLAESQLEAAAQQKKKRSFPINFKIPLSIRRFLTLDVIIGLGVVILLIVFSTWGASYLIRKNAAITPEPSAPSISNILSSSTVSGETTSTVASTQALSTISQAPVGSPVFTIPTSGGSPVQIVLYSTRTVWIKVTVDNVVKFTGRTEPGLVYVYNANTQIEVVAGDGSAINIIYNQADLGPMGGRGELVDRIYTATAILLPTPTATPTSTITLTPTITPRPSATPRYSPTPEQ